MRLIVVRHGETAYNLQNRITGQADIPLSPLGEQQAELTGAYLASEKIDVIVASDLQRAQVTAQAIANYHSLPVQSDANLREIAMGRWEGYTGKELTTMFPEERARWKTSVIDYAVPGGESMVQVDIRIQQALERWYGQHPEETVVWVTHGGFIGILVCHLLELDIRRREQFRHENASINEFWLRQDKSVVVMHLNETAHLAGIRHVEGAEA